MSTPKKLWIDTDCGIDDSTAILICLACPDYEVVGISCLGGNASLANVVHNVNRTLKVWGHGAEKIPVYAGCADALVVKQMHAPTIHGKDGLGDIDDSVFDYDLNDTVQTEHAVNALINAANTIPDLTLLTLGPLTNIAIAFRMNPVAMNKLKEIWVMGGTSDHVGNCTKWAEFNIRADPEAAQAIFRDYDNSKITISSWTLTQMNRLKPNEVTRLTGREDTTIAKWMHHTWATMIKFCAKTVNDGTIATADPVAAFCMCYADKGVKKWERFKVNVVLHGEQIGMTDAVPDPNGIRYAMEIDHEMYLQTLDNLMADH
ncbi:Inosine-uridine preferring nucleoside hydrolase family protein [Trichomonas vaginalis G3]|uniref:Inosine-uridine preferring nucleoside hydrolase family protein n=1 Tax=Trichomonas vaginalis (strain ATCC PRA-98 / G3) TaxID=412133 RepID=A2E1Q3_TRIV3|nr:purine nucleosidase protein [Trichomonas vaginalis G3]EAY13382.1 Inosine-uridine preferring nucleoside hydrolase family protein [Trichomonas vaginalis G3]KAI5528135.1 purine nucleosidase protein [Trichomonas vaginalis G3]|eukprot:XP_001325605.1 Inosine-uridine preferring nucleoside hydrolase family protein [Trichomonas vaginalis G3]